MSARPNPSLSPKAAAPTLRPAPLLLHQWGRALVFRIGESDSEELAQLPSLRDFPCCFPTENPNAAWALGRVLGVALLKLFRPWEIEAGERVELDCCAADFGDIKDALSTACRSYRDDLEGACMHLIGRALEMALRAPERLPRLIARIDALDNAALHAMAMQAVQGREHEVFDIFEGLMQ